jgi:hypothetical protein
MNQLRSYWIDLRASLWFVPSLIVLASMGAAVLMTETDGRVGMGMGMELATHWPRLFGASADASRGIGIGSMLQFALDHDRIVRLAAATGAFVAAGSAVIDLSGSDAPTQDDARRLRGWAKPGAPAHDGAGRGLRPAAAGRCGAQGAVPGINDPTTARMCIDRLGALLGWLASRRFPDPHRMARRRLRVIALAPDFAAIVKLALDPIVAHSRGDLQMLGRMLDAPGCWSARCAKPAPAERQRNPEGMAMDFDPGRKQHQRAAAPVGAATAVRRVDLAGPGACAGRRHADTASRPAPTRRAKKPGNSE